MGSREIDARRRRIDELRYEHKARSALDQLTAAGIASAQQAVVAYERALATWRPFIDRLAHGDATRLRLSGGDDAGVQRILDSKSAATSGLTVVCFWLVDSTPVAITVRATDVLRRATDSVVSRQRDLMLTTPDASSGLCVELNHESDGDFYDVAGWGVFGTLQGSAFG